MENLRTTPKFLKELWDYANQVKDAVKGYKVIVCNYQLATYDMSFHGQASTQYHEVSKFYERAILYVDAAEEANKEEKNKKSAPKANISEPERNAAMFKPYTLLHNCLINEFRQW